MVLSLISCRPGCRHLAALFLVLTLSGTGLNAEDQPAPKRADLAGSERKVFSQFGEDGVIEKIFDIIKPGPKYAVEFGAWDGVLNSNMRNLVVNHGWSSFQIEGHPERAAALAKNYADYPTTKTQEAWVWPGNIEILFEDAGVPKDLDLLVIDIDSNDYYVWRAIHDFRPKVVMIETNLDFPPPELMVINFHPMNYWDGTPYSGASMQSMYNLAKKKGYELIYQMSKGPNTFWVAKEYFPAFGITDNSPATMYRKSVALQFFLESATWGHDDVPWPEDKQVLTWENLVIEKKFLSNR